MIRNLSLMVILFLTLNLPLAAQATQLSEDSAKLRFAATQHEIILILIKESEFERVLPEFQKILDLQFSAENERLIVQEVWILSKNLMDLQQFNLAHEMIRLSLERLKEPESHFSLLMLQGKVFKQQGRPRAAIEAYRQAQAIQAGNVNE